MEDEPKFSSSQMFQYFKSLSNSYGGARFALYFQSQDLTKDGRRFLKEIMEDERVKSLKGKKVVNGGGLHLFSSQMFAVWFHWYVDEVGYEAAKVALDKFLDADKVPVLVALWVIGIRVKETISLTNGVEIRPIEGMPESYIKAEFQPVGFPREDLPKAAIVKRYETTKVPAVKEYPREPKNLSRMLESTALLLNALPNTICQPYVFTTQSEKGHPYGPFGDMSSSQESIEVNRNLDATELKSSQKEDIEALMDRFAKLESKQQERNLRILQRLSQAKGRAQVADKILDLGIALEMLLLNDNNESRQLSFAFKLRGSWLIGNDYEERDRIFRLLDEIYRYRSNVAHSGLLAKGDAQKIADIRMKFPEYQKVAEHIFNALFFSDDPVWKHLFLGGELS